MSVVDGSNDYPLACEEHAAMTLAGGIAGMGFQCGQIWGAALAAGAQAYRLYGPGPQAEAAAVLVSQRLVESFRASYKAINCQDVTQINWKKPRGSQILGYFLKGGVIRCFSMTAGYARTAFYEINAALSSNNLLATDSIEMPRSVSCAAVLARRMGVSDMHAVMAAGFAGGIGLSGGACGALGAAIWIHTMNSGKKSFDLTDPETMDMIDRFVEVTEVRFDCSEIVGRKFVGINDHACYVRDGGCSKIIEELANIG